MSIKLRSIESLNTVEIRKGESGFAYPVSSSKGRGPSNPGSTSTFEPS